MAPSGLIKANKVVRPTTARQTRSSSTRAAAGSARSAASNAGHRAATAAGGTHRGWARRRRITKKEMVQFSSQLALMTRSGVDLVSALESLRRQCRSPQLKAILQDVHSQVLDGRSFSESLRNAPGVFNQAFVASIAAGEAAGKLPDVLSRLSYFERNALRLRNTLRSMLTYPIVLVAVSSTVVLGLILFVLPTFAEIFADYDMPLPLLTQWLVDASTTARERWWFWGGLLAVAGLGAGAFRQSATGRWWLDYVALHGPLIGSITQALLVGRTCQLLGLLLQSGVPLLEALRLSRGSVGNHLYRDLFAELEKEVTNGQGIAEAISSRRFVPSYAVEMIATAERTGKLGSVLQLVGDHFQEEGESSMRGLIALLEPAITVIMGAIVAVIVLSVMLPMFDLTRVAEQGG